ncbi:MAG TPA: UbiA family prenyltransferase [Methanomicrobiales archaeon]|nr:UbiA family prenyltransferase [Methanomicrobiales archaeon]
MNAGELARYRGWKAWQSHDMHVSLLSIFYLLLADRLAVPSVFSPWKSLVLVLSLGFYFMCGFLINDLFDLAHDLQAGKTRAVQRLPRPAFAGIIISFIALIIIMLWYLGSAGYAAVYGFSFFLGTLYSAPGVRFKERGALGIVVNALTEKAFPVLAIFVFFGHFGADTALFVVTAFLLQTVEIFTHQIYDYEADQGAGVRTFARDAGRERTLLIFRYLVVPLSLAAMLLLCLLVVLLVPALVLVIAAVCAVYLVLYLGVARGRLSMEEKVLPLPMSVPYLLINNAFPVVLAFILVAVSPSNILLLFFALASQIYLFRQLLRLLRERAIPRTEIADA